MYALFKHRFQLAAIWALCVSSAVLALDPLHSPYGGRGKSCQNPTYDVCRGICSSRYLPPTVHPGTIFGYYPTAWSPWPGSNFGVVRMTGTGIPEISQPPLAPTGPEVEPLPLPRPLEGRMRKSGPTRPAAYRDRQ
jgi:hypothetical protein